MKKEKGSILMAMIPVFAILMISIGVAVYNNANEEFRNASSTLEDMERKYNNSYEYENDYYNMIDDYDDYDDYYNMIEDY